MPRKANHLSSSSLPSAQLRTGAGTHSPRQQFGEECVIHLVRTRAQRGMGPGSRFACPGRRGVRIRIHYQTPRGYTFAFSRRSSPEACLKFHPPKNKRAQERPDARCTRGLVCNMHKKNAHEHTGSAEAIRPSLRSGFTAYNVPSSVNGLSCHRRPQQAFASHELDTSVAVSGPHDFAVRFSRARQSQLSRPPHPTARS